MLLRVYRAAFSGLPREVWLLALTTLVNRAGTMVVPFMTLYLTASLRFSVLEAGQILSLWGLGGVLGSFLGGWLSDRIGAVRVQLASLAASGVGFLVLASLRSRPAIAVTVLLLATVAESFRPALMTAVAQAAAPAVRTRSLALIRLAINLGMTVGPAVGGLLAVRHYTLLFVVDAFTCWAAAAVLASQAARFAPPAAWSAARGARLGVSPWRDGRFLVFLSLMVGLALVFFQILSTVPLFLREHYRFSEATIGALFAANAVMVASLEMVILHGIERFEHLRVAGIGCLLVCAGFALLPEGSGLIWALVTTVVWTIGEMLSLPMTNSVAAARPPSHAAGSYMGAYTLAFSLGSILAPLVGTAIYQRFGGEVLFRLLWLAGLLLLAGMFLLARRFHEQGPRASRPVEP